MTRSGADQAPGSEQGSVTPQASTAASAEPPPAAIADALSAMFCWTMAWQTHQGCEAQARRPALLSRQFQGHVGNATGEHGGVRQAARSGGACRHTAGCCGTTGPLYARQVRAALPWLTLVPMPCKSTTTGKAACSMPDAACSHSTPGCSINIPTP